MINRRNLLTQIGGAAALPLLGMPQRAAAFSGQPLKQAAHTAWLFGLPLIEMAASRAQSLTQMGVNTLGHARQLTTISTQFVTTPNNDTLYSRAWINLNNGPVRVTLPKTAERYLSYAFMDMYSNNFAILGTRTTGGDGGTFTLVGPNDATTDPFAIRSPTPWVWLLVRLLIDNDADLPAAHALQNQMTIDAPSAPAPAPFNASRTSHWAEYFNAVQSLIVENHPRATDDLAFDHMAPLGITPRGGFDPTRFTPAQIAEIKAGILSAQQSLRASGRPGPLINGWVYPKSNMGDFGQDYLYRAQVAIGGLAALPRAEAMYMRPITSQNSQLWDASKNWRLTFPKDALPPVDSFWSLTMYRATPEGQFYFFDNVINRYAIGNRTKDLRYDANSDLTIWMSREDPGPDRRSNWLPLPTDAPFAPVFRGYLPKSEMLDGAYTLPRIVAA